MKKLVSLKKATLLCAALSAGITSQLMAQVTLSYPDATPAATFTTIQLAYNAIDFAAHPGAHTITIDGTYASSAETFPITLGAKTGADATNTVTIKPATGAKVTIGNSNSTSIFTNVGTLTTSGVLTVAQSTANIATGMTVYGYGPFSGSAAHPTVSSFDATTITCSRNMSTAQTGATIYVGTPNTKTILIDGGDYITIDGVSRTDASTGLTIQNPNSIQASTIWIDASSSYNTIKNCFIKGANVSGMAYNNGGCGQIMFYNGNNDFNTITNNDICDMDGLPMPICMVMMAYGGSSSNNDNTISNNNIYNIGNGTSPNGNVQVFGFSSTNNTNSFNNSILNNRIYWTKTAEFRTNPYIFGMGGGYNGLGNRIEGNTIGWQADGVTPAELTAPLNTAATFYGSNVKNCTFKNNVIGGINWASKVFVGFQIFAHNTSTPNADSVCYGNQVKDINVNSSVSGANFYGIMISASSPFTFNIKNNIVKNVTVSSPTAGNTCTLNGILNNFGAPTTLYNVNCIGNEVSNLTAGNEGSSAANSIIGFVNGGAVSTVEKNLIYNLNTKSTGTGSVIKGLRFALSNANGANIQNNIVRLGTDVSSDAEIHAIFHEATSNDSHTFKFLHNTVYIGGTSATKNTHIFTHTGALKSVVTLKNNIFSNVRTGGAAVNEIYNLVTNSDIATTDYNLYQYNGQFAYTLTTPVATAFTTLNDWNSGRILASPAALSEDMNSKDQKDPLFTDALASIPNLHVGKTSPANAAGDATIVVADDFEGMVRADYSPSDLGAYVIGTSTAIDGMPAATTQSVYAANGRIIFSKLNGQTARISAVSGQLIKSVVIASDNASVALPKGLYIVQVAGKTVKVAVK